MSFELKKIEMSEDEFKNQNQSEDFGEILEVFEDDELKETEIDPDACIKEVKTKSHKNNSAVKLVMIFNHYLKILINLLTKIFILIEKEHLYE